jgi:glutamine cyclotransferase
MQLSQLGYDEQSKYTVVNKCSIQRYFTQGIEVIDKGVLAISAGWFGRSKLVILNYDFDNCNFNENFS